MYVYHDISRKLSRNCYKENGKNTEMHMITMSRTSRPKMFRTFWMNLVDRFNTIMTIRIETLLCAFRLSKAWLFDGVTLEEQYISYFKWVTETEPSHRDGFCDMFVILYNLSEIFLFCGYGKWSKLI